MCSYGIVDWKENPSDKKQHLYYKSSDLNVNTLEYIKKKIIEKSKGDDSFVPSRLKEMLRPSSEIGHIHIEDLNGNPVNEEQIQAILLTNASQTNNNIVAQA